MMIYEFRELLPEGVKVTDEDYYMIEDVYMYYPAKIEKKDIANLYVKYGMTLIKDMLKRAKIVKAMEEECTHLMGKVNSLQNSIKFLEQGHDPENLDDNIKEEFHIGAIEAWNRREGDADRTKSNLCKSEELGF